MTTLDMWTIDIMNSPLSRAIHPWYSVEIYADEVYAWYSKISAHPDKATSNL